MFARARRSFAWAAAATDAAALVAALLHRAGIPCNGTSWTSASPGGAGSALGAIPAPVAPAPVPPVCHHALLVAPLSSATGAAAALLVLSALGLVPFLTLNGRRGWPAAVAATGVAALYLVSFAVLIDWLPMMLCVLAAALSPAERTAPVAAAYRLRALRTATRPTGAQERRASWTTTP